LPNEAGSERERYLFPEPFERAMGSEHRPPFPNPWLLSLLTLLLVSTMQPQVQAEAGRIRVLATGWLDFRPTILNSFTQDPLVTCAMVPSNFAMAEWDQQLVELVGGRRVRLYFPRSRDALVENHDFLVFEDTWLESFRTSQVADMRYAVEEGGLGAFVTLGNSLSGPTAWGWYGWHHSALREIMPTEFTERMSTSARARSAGFTVVIRKDEPPVLSMFRQFDLEELAGAGNAWLEPRPGCETWAEMAHPCASSTGSNAFLLSWKVSRGGHFWVVADNLFSLWWAPHHNEYALDIFVNILLHSTGRELPGDIVVVHSIRRQYWLYAQYESYLQSLFAFVEAFGASTMGPALQLEEIGQERARSFGEFREGRYEDALGTIRLAMEKLGHLEEETFALKDRTLLWVYAIQWTVVTSVFLISGVALWSLMVRRRLFREVSTTKLASRQ
jgi:hypothetical protein